MYVYIYIYIYREREREREIAQPRALAAHAGGRKQLCCTAEYRYPADRAIYTINKQYGMTLHAVIYLSIYDMHTHNLNST